MRERHEKQCLSVPIEWASLLAYKCYGRGNQRFTIFSEANLKNPNNQWQLNQSTRLLLFKKLVVSCLWYRYTACLCYLTVICVRQVNGFQFVLPEWSYLLGHVVKSSVDIKWWVSVSAVWSVYWLWLLCSTAVIKHKLIHQEWKKGCEH